VITPVGIVFKGSGFYVTDNKNGKASSTLNGTGASSTTKESDETKSDKKSSAADTKASSESASASASSAA
jgi:predicted nucleic acid-binding Zn ribbon protein